MGARGARRWWTAKALAALTLLPCLVAGCTPAAGGGEAGVPTSTIESSSSTTPTDDGDRVCGEGHCLSLTALATALSKRLDGRVVGHLELIGYGVQATGLARTGADPPQLAMGAQVTASDAGTGSLFTAIAVLHSLAAHHRDPDQRIAPFLPPGWKRGPGVADLTVADLLSQRSGFRLDGRYVFSSDDAARRQVAEGVLARDHGVVQDNPINVALVRDLLPAMEGVADPGPARRRAEADRFFQAYLEKHVFAPSGVTGARCGTALGSTRGSMLMYPTLTSLSPREHGVPPEAGPAACAVGGWSLSAADIRQVLAALVTGQLLPARWRERMDSGCLGWQCPTGAPGAPGLLGRAGVWADPSGASTLSVYAGVLFGRVPLLVLANSYPGGDLTSIVPDALASARVS